MSDPRDSTYADTIFMGGDIITVDDSNPTAEALAVKDGKITAVGSREKVLQEQGPETQMIDLAGKTLSSPTVIPSSAHFFTIGLTSVELPTQVVKR